MARFFRKENPPKCKNHRDYLPSLRLDFRYRCAYCERPEAVVGGDEAFEVDHFRPRSRFPELVNEYSNLYYSCSRCNRHKGNTWPSEHLAGSGFRFSDPCAEDMYSIHAIEGDGGRLKAITQCGEYTVRHIMLNRPVLVNWREARRIRRRDLESRQLFVERLSQLLNTRTDDREWADMQRELDSLRREIERDRAMYLEN